MNSLVWLALVLLVAWLILKMALAVTSGLIHLLWIAALIMFAMWAFGKLRGTSGRVS
jgi:hypothetical protein